ncbi:hypothetical protein [Sporisorium scitamineum]|uniref:C2H2-type domain-containing protein n=1 Tax=Sporisorium scitamineum TaxID=49012 RepID=A0A0F7RYP6_9BASI|nr:hypothetical protein [Sporisorium scitamineum]
MTSVLANVRSHFTQSGMSNEPRFQYADLSRAMAPSTSSSTLSHANPSSSSSSSNMPLSSSSLALASATPATTMSSAPATSDVAPHSQPSSIMPTSVTDSDPNSLYSSSTIPSSRAFDSVLTSYTAPSTLADVSASCPPEGPSFSTNDFDANLAAAAFAPMFSSNDATGLDDSSAPLSFPVLPASLLDEAPEYEYSVHTRLNVFEATDFGADIPSFSFADNGTPLLDGTAEYALWSTGLGVEAGNLAASSAFSYPNDELALIDSNSRLETQPRTAGHFDPFARPEESFDARSESLLAPRNALPLASSSSNASANALLGSNVSSDLTSLPGSSAAGLVDGAPSVLHPGPSSNQLHQRQPQPAATQRVSLEGDEMYESQAGPSRGLNRPRDALLNANSPYGRVRPTLQAQRSLSNINTAASFSPQGFNPELRRLSTGAGAGRGPSRDPVVPSQNVGRARLMSWQSGRAHSGEQDWQSSNLADSALGVSGEAGLGLGAHGMSDSMVSNGMSMHAGGMMPPSRSYGYGMHPFSSGFMPHHGMNPHQTDMINALGDAMDARIDVDGIAKCPYPNCNKTFAKNRSYNLKAHLRSHSQLKPFACSVCPRAFSRKHDLERHSRVHSGDKPYVCEICGKGFPRSDALRRHWRVEKECGDKAAALEASQSLTSVLGEGGMGYSHERSPDHQSHHLQYGQPLQGSSSSGMYGHALFLF